MGDYGRDIELGVSVAPNAAEIDLVRAVATKADALGIDFFGVQDHPYQRRFVETWMLLADVLARTEHVRVFPDVATALPGSTPGPSPRTRSRSGSVSSSRGRSSWPAAWPTAGCRRSPLRRPRRSPRCRSASCPGSARPSDARAAPDGPHQPCVSSARTSSSRGSVSQSPVPARAAPAITLPTRAHSLGSKPASSP